MVNRFLQLRKNLPTMVNTCVLFALCAI